MNSEEADIITLSDSSERVLRGRRTHTAHNQEAGFHIRVSESWVKHEVGQGPDVGLAEALGKSEALGSGTKVQIHLRTLTSCCSYQSSQIFSSCLKCKERDFL